jgi:uncharacterized membrane protein HdeD (DUF308 family)
MHLRRLPMTALRQGLAAILSRTWWMLLLRGILAIVFAIFAWVQPGISINLLVIMFGGYVLFDGIFGVGAALAGRNEDENWVLLLLWGLVGIGVGLLTLLVPAVTALALLFYIAIWSIATGVLQIAMAIRLRKEISNEFWLILGGLASVAVGVILMARPGAGAVALIWLIAAYAFIFGIVLTIVAFRARSFGKHLQAA